jgi:hypothetical protein
MIIKILKAFMGVALISSSSMALAEGKFAYRQPMQGVDASPTFGMTSVEKQEYNMCLNEKIFLEEEIYYEEDEVDIVIPDNTFVLDIENGFYMLRTGYGDAVEYYWDGERVDSLGGAGGIHRYVDSPDEIKNSPYYDKFITSGYRVFVIRGSGSYEHQYSYVTYDGDYNTGEKEIKEVEKTRMVEQKTENYDWCVLNGYPTAN